MWLILFWNPILNLIKSLMRFAQHLFIAVIAIIIFGVLLYFILLVTAGAFYYAIYAIWCLIKKQKSLPFLAFAFLLNVFGLVCLTTETLKEYPFLFRLAFLGNFMAFIPMATYLLLYPFKNKAISHFMGFLSAIGFIAITVYSLFLFNQNQKIAELALSAENEFDNVYWQQKRDKYLISYNLFISKHNTVPINDFNLFNIESGDHGGLFSNNKPDEDSMVALHFGPTIGLIYYSYGSGYYKGPGTLSETFFSNGLEVYYNNGRLTFDTKKDTVDATAIYYAKWRGETIYRQLVFEVIVLPKNIDSYIHYKENDNFYLSHDYNKHLFMSEEYLNNHKIPIYPQDYTKLYSKDD